MFCCRHKIKDILRKQVKKKKDALHIMETFNRLETNGHNISLYLNIVEQKLTEAAKAHPDSDSKNVIEYPIDFMEPEGETTFAYFTEVFEHEGCSIAYCESDKEEDKYIPLTNKGNRFYKVSSKLEMLHYD